MPHSTRPGCGCRRSLGYLAAGLAVGPFTPGFVADIALAEQLGEIGIVILMFGVGLHFSVRDLLADRAAERDAFEAGSGDYAADEAGESILDEPPEADRIHTKELLARLVGNVDKQNVSHPPRIRKVMETLGWTHRRGVRVLGQVAAGYVRDPDDR